MSETLSSITHGLWKSDAMKKAPPEMAVQECWQQNRTALGEQFAVILIISHKGRSILWRK